MSVDGRVGRVLENVFCLTATQAGRQVVLRILPPIISVDTGRRARFCRRAQILAFLVYYNVPARSTTRKKEQNKGARVLAIRPTAGRAARQNLRFLESTRVRRRLVGGLEPSVKGRVRRRRRGADKLRIRN